VANWLRERDNVVYWKTEGKINNDLQCVFKLIFLKLRVFIED